MYCSVSQFYYPLQKVVLTDKAPCSLLLYFSPALFLFFSSLYFSYVSDTAMKTSIACLIVHNIKASNLPSICIYSHHTLSLSLQVGEIRAHAAEWTANVSAEFRETRRRVSVEIYDKFQRAASIKRKLSSELGFSPTTELTVPERTVSVNFNDERDRNEREAGLHGLTTPLVRNGGLFMNGFDPERGNISVIEHLSK